MNRPSDPLYGRAALERTAAALRPGGILAIWSEEPDAAFEARLEATGFSAARHPGGRGGRAHVIYLGVRAAQDRVGKDRGGKDRGGKDRGGKDRDRQPGRAGGAPGPTGSRRR